MQNIEFKSELRDPVAARAAAKKLGARLIGTLDQTDTYFRIPDGRLKRREVPHEPVEWIYYHRPDRITPRMSHFNIYSDAEAKTRWGLTSLRPWITVHKFRELHLWQNVRIHIDEVEGLGSFLEFEAQVSPKFDVETCHNQIAQLRQTFGPILGEAISGSYADMLDQQNREAEL